jgi:glyoxylate reductase
MTAPDRPARPKVVVTRELTDGVMHRMGELFDATLNRKDRALSRSELEAAVADTDVLVPTITDRIDADLLAKASPRLKLIANFGVGVDHIDLHAARERKILVTNTPGVLTEDTADMTMALILSVPRRLGEGEKLIRAGQWDGWKPSGMLGHRVNGKILGIIGMGRIGRAIARRANGFGIRVIYHNRHRLPEGVAAHPVGPGCCRDAQQHVHSAQLLVDHLVPPPASPRSPTLVQGDCCAQQAVGHAAALHWHGRLEEVPCCC